MISRKLSALKSIVWRLMGVGFLAAVTYYFTGSWITTTLVTFAHHATFLVVYYLHERFWLRYDPKLKRLLKVITYEIILGQVILGFITWTFTGSIPIATKITTFYIWNKIWIYLIYDYFWSKLERGK